MNRLQFHTLIAAGLVSIIVLIVLVVSLTATAVASVTTFRFTWPFATFVDSDSVAASLQHAHPSETGLPETSNQNRVELAGHLTTLTYPAPEDNLADFHNFVTRISNGQKDVIRGVHVSGLFSLPVIQQPQNSPIFVSNKHDRVTQFQNAARNGVTGLLAHNYLAGGQFYKLVPGHEILVVYGNGDIQRYRVVSTHRYQKLSPSNLHSNLVDLSSGKEVSVTDVFNRFYRGEHHLTFQTCLERNGRLNWGFLFVVAVPVEV